MRILIAGIDGYLGWTLAQYLGSRGYDVGGVDAMFRRKWVAEGESHSAIPIASMDERMQAYAEHFGRLLYFREGDLTDWSFVQSVFEEFAPDAIVHLGECPSAPYSMMDVQHATWVQQNNIVGTLNILYAMHHFAPASHLVKLGTMGEYGTPNVDIPEGFIDLEFRGRKDRLPFPRSAGSWYHWSKVHDSNNVMFACRVMGLRSTDVMQGVVYGTRVDEMGPGEAFNTRLDFDESFGTAINRFCCQAVIGEPLTPYGKGTQKRAFLPLRDSMQCLTLAIENPPDAGEYRVFNQFEQGYDILELVSKVQSVANELGLDAEIRHLENPRMEMEEHYYNPDHQHLLDLGYQPTHDMESELRVMMADLTRHKARIAERASVLVPSIRWAGGKEKVAYLEPAESVAGDLARARS